jgi:hypothetical protein
MAEITNGLNKIEPITLGEAVFGNGLNERLEQIDDNFQSIITSEYLKGDSGTSFGYATFSNEDGFTNPTDIFVDNTSPNSISLTDLYVVLCNVIGRDVDLGKFEFTFIYEIINGKKIAKSSLPFVYYDPSIYGISQDLEQGDRSCVVIYDNGKFKKLNAFPTIYYNKEDDKFYWKINGIETKLTATGPKGERGLAGGFNIVTVGTNYTENNNIKEYTIEKFLYQDPVNNTYRFVDISEVDEEDQQIAEKVLIQDSPCIVLQNTSSEQFIAIGPVNLNGYDSNGNIIYYVRIWDELAISHSMDASLLMQIFDKMGPGGPLRGLYIPAAKEGDTVLEQHAIYRDSADKNKLHIKYVNGNFNPLSNSKLKLDTNYNILSSGYGYFQRVMGDYFMHSSELGAIYFAPDTKIISYNRDVVLEATDKIKMLSPVDINGKADFYGWAQFYGNSIFNDGVTFNKSVAFNGPTMFREDLGIASDIRLLGDISILPLDTAPNSKITIKSPVSFESQINANGLTTTGDVSAAGGLFKVYPAVGDVIVGNGSFIVNGATGTITAAGGKFIVDGSTGDIVKLANVSNPKIQYKPIAKPEIVISNATNFTKVDITIGIDPGNHPLPCLLKYDIEMDYKNTSDNITRYNKTILSGNYDNSINGYKPSDTFTKHLSLSNSEKIKVGQDVTIRIQNIEIIYNYGMKFTKDDKVYIIYSDGTIGDDQINNMMIFHSELADPVTVMYKY